MKTLVKSKIDDKCTIVVNGIKYNWNEIFKVYESAYNVKTEKKVPPSFLYVES